MTTRDQDRKPRFSCLLLLAGSLLATAAGAEEEVEPGKIENLILPGYSRALDSDGFESRKFSKNFKVKGWRLTRDLYMGGVKVNGEYGPGVVFDKGGYVWGFNHERIEFQLRF